MVPLVRLRVKPVLAIDAMAFFYENVPKRIRWATVG